MGSKKGPKDAADRILSDIASMKKSYDSISKKATAEIDVIRKKHAPALGKARKKIEALEKQLAKHVKSNRVGILGDGDRADLRGGSVMLKTETHVKRIKGMLDKLKAAGLTNAIKTAKEHVNWDRIEMFNDDALTRLGTERIKKTLFSYELKGGS